LFWVPTLGANAEAPRGRQAADDGAKTGKTGQIQAKIAYFGQKPKKYVEKPPFLVDFAHPKAAL